MPEDVMYRPPFEADSLLLEVTRGCSHNRCSFCTMYRDVPFAVIPEDQIRRSIQREAQYRPQARRVFLENGDPFALDAERLLHIAELVRTSLPHVETIAMYASVNNIANKSDNDLVRLRKAGINELNIGVESGLDSALSLMNKGYSAEQALSELLRLRSAGIDYGANIIFGCAGSGNWKANAETTAGLLNATSPYLIFTGTIHADPGCPLYDAMRDGSFAESTFGEYLDEEELLLSMLNLENCLYFGLHPSNVVPMQGLISRDREAMLREIRNMRTRLCGHLDQHPVRTGEGAILNRR